MHTKPRIQIGLRSACKMIPVDIEDLRGASSIPSRCRKLVMVLTSDAPRAKTKTIGPSWPRDRDRD